jgi:uncharacterized protein (DUF433 family)
LHDSFAIFPGRATEAEMATAMTQAMLDWSLCPELESIPGKVSGAWVFRGTRVPVSAILRNLKDFDVDEVVAEFPSVTRDQVPKVLNFIARSADPQAPLR